MEQTVFLFFNRRQFASWRTENCENCRKESAEASGCELSAALMDALFLEGVVPLEIAERIGFFDMDDDDRLVPPDTWTCREFQEKDLLWARPSPVDSRRQPA